MMQPIFTGEPNRDDSERSQPSRQAGEGAERSPSLPELAGTSTHEGMLVVDRSGKIAPLNERPGAGWGIPQGGRTLPLNQRFSRMWHIPQTLLNRLIRENDLRDALEREELAVYFQPLANLQSGRIDGVEALARWHDPDRGLVLPGDFIPLAEQTGLIVRLGEWVLRTACAQTEAWQKAGLSPLRVAVNLSARQFEQPGFAELVAGVLKETHLNPDSLELEITENTTMRSPDLAIGVLGDLRALGVRISMDDFGVGYSSLAHLKDLPIQTLKIDRSLVHGITEGRNDAAIAAAIIAMAYSLDLEVVAEGVETDSQLAFLKEQQCHRFQGFLLSKPMPGETLATMLMSSAQSHAA